MASPLERGPVAKSVLPTLCDIPGGSLFLYGALDSHPFFPSRAALGCCVLSAAVAFVTAGVVFALAEPSSWHTGVVLVAAAVVCRPPTGPKSSRGGGVGVRV